MNGVCYDHILLSHGDDRRDIMMIFNDDLGNFQAHQIKTLTFKKDVALKSHFHEHAEFFYCAAGQGDFTLKNIDDGSIATYTLTPGDRLLIPARVAHKITCTKDTILIGATETSFVSGADDIKPYTF